MKMLSQNRFLLILLLIFIIITCFHSSSPFSSSTTTTTTTFFVSAADDSNHERVFYLADPSYLDGTNVKIGRLEFQYAATDARRFLVCDDYMTVAAANLLCRLSTNSEYNRGSYFRKAVSLSSTGHSFALDDVKCNYDSVKDVIDDDVSSSTSTSTNSSSLLGVFEDKCVFKRSHNCVSSETVHLACWKSNVGIKSGNYYLRLARGPQQLLEARPVTSTNASSFGRLCRSHVTFSTSTALRICNFLQFSTLFYAYFSLSSSSSSTTPPSVSAEMSLDSCSNFASDFNGCTFTAYPQTSTLTCSQQGGQKDLALSCGVYSYSTAPADDSFGLASVIGFSLLGVFLLFVIVGSIGTCCDDSCRCRKNNGSDSDADDDGNNNNNNNNNNRQRRHGAAGGATGLGDEEMRELERREAVRNVWMLSQGEGLEGQEVGGGNSNTNSNIVVAGIPTTASASATSSSSSAAVQQQTQSFNLGYKNENQVFYGQSNNYNLNFQPPPGYANATSAFPFPSSSLDSNSNNNNHELGGGDSSNNNNDSVQPQLPGVIPN